MKTNSFFTIVVLLSTINTLFSQHDSLKKINDNSVKIKKLRVSEVYVQLAKLREKQSISTINDFKSLAPQSALLNNDFSNYTQSASPNKTITNHKMLNRGFTTNDYMAAALLGIQFYDKAKQQYRANPLLRVGVSYYSGTNYSDNLYNDSRNAYDTLKSAKTGQTVFVDSLSKKTYKMNNKSEQLRVDISFIYRTNSKARFSIYGGIGITGGFSFNNVTTIKYTDTHYLENSNTTTDFYNSNTTANNTTVTETFRNKSDFCASSYLPMGLDFRIGKKNQLLKQLHLFYELRPSINVTKLPELRTSVSSSFQQGLGLKVAF